MSIYDDDWGAVDTPRRGSLTEQEQAGPLGKGNYVAPGPKSVVAVPMQPSPDGYAPYAAPMNEVRLVHTSTPEARGRALFQKTLGVSLFLWGFTLAALAVLDGFSFMVWLLFASLEGVICFIVFATLDYREHPMYMRKLLATGYLKLMRRDQTMRHVATYGIETVRQARELDNEYR